MLVLLLHVVCMHALYREFEGRTHYEDSLLETAKRLSDKRNYKESFEVLTKLRENGLIALSAKSVLRLLPPLTITKAETDKGLAALKKTLAELP